MFIRIIELFKKNLRFAQSLLLTQTSFSFLTYPCWHSHPAKHLLLMQGGLLGSAHEGWQVIA
jgi:hypothetical protein